VVCINLSLPAGRCEKICNFLQAGVHKSVIACRQV
jgi:hypothetical protein